MGHKNEMLEKMLEDLGMDDIKVQGVLFCIQKAVHEEIKMIIDPVNKMMEDAQGQAMVSLQAVNILKEILMEKNIISESEYNELAEEMIDKQRKVYEILHTDKTREQKISAVKRVFDDDEEQATQIVDMSIGKNGNQ